MQSNVVLHELEDTYNRIPAPNEEKRTEKNQFSVRDTSKV